VQSNFNFFWKTTLHTELPTLKDIRGKIFQERMTEEQLVAMLNRDSGRGYSRGHIVNWSNLLRDSKKKTIEFRQHACTLSVPEIHQWIEFLFACVWTAERLADMAVPVTTDPEATYAEQEGSKYSEVDEYHISNTVEDLCGPDLLGLQEEQTQYWKQRYNRYKREKALYRPTVETRMARLEKAQLARIEEAAVLEGWQDFDAMDIGEN
jgi:hypothetical protein